MITGRMPQNAEEAAFAAYTMVTALMEALLESKHLTKDSATAIIAAAKTKVDGCAYYRRPEIAEFMKTLGVKA